MKLRQMSLANKVALFFILVFAIGGASLFQTLRHYQERDLLERSRTTAKLLDSFLKLSNDVHGFWVANPGELKVVEHLNGLIEGSGDEQDLYLLHDPELDKALLQSLGSQGNIKVTFGDPGDFRSPKAEKWSFKGDEFVYQYALPVHANCIHCHERFPKAPRLQEHQVAGVLTVTFPGQGILQLFSGSFNIWLAVSFLIGTLALYALVRFELINPLTTLTRKVHEMSLGNLDIDLKVRGLNEDEVKDEIMRLALAIERLRRSQKTMEKMLDDDSFEL